MDHLQVVNVILPCLCSHRCAGKIIHNQLTKHAKSKDKASLASRFVNECNQMNKARHPNIVLFLGVYFKEHCKFPILVMEYLPMCLDECLTKYHNLPPYVKNNILLDVAQGLQYLHTEGVVHRDLTTRNILIGDNLHAKIADLGVAKIISADIADQFQELTEVPGNAQYMPPEAFAKASDQRRVEYDDKLDIFSYGILVVHTVTHQWPNPKSTVHVTKEIERRRKDLDLMGECHPLRSLTEQCLSDKPVYRPSVSSIVSGLEKVIHDNPAPFRNTMELLQDYCRISSENKKSQDQLKESEEKKHQLEQMVSQLSDQHEANVQQISVQEMEIQDMQRLLSAKQQEISVKESLLSRRGEKIRALNMRIAATSQTSKSQVCLPKNKPCKIILDL